MVVTGDVGGYPPDDDEAGRVAYDAYRGEAGSRSTVTGDPLPEWEDLAESTRAAWRASADAVRRRYGRIH